MSTWLRFTILAAQLPGMLLGICSPLPPRKPHMLSKVPRTVRQPSFSLPQALKTEGKAVQKLMAVLLTLAIADKQKRLAPEQC